MELIFVAADGTCWSLASLCDSVKDLALFFFSFCTWSGFGVVLVLVLVFLFFFFLVVWLRSKVGAKETDQFWKLEFFVK